MASSFKRRSGSSGSRRSTTPQSLDFTGSSIRNSGGGGMHSRGSVGNTTRGMGRASDRAVDRSSGRADRASDRADRAAARNATRGASRGNSRSERRSSRSASRDTYVASGESQLYVSERMGDIQNAERDKRLRSSRNKWTARIVLILILVALLIAGGIVLYVSPILQVKHVTARGSSHLTDQEMIALADIPEGTTLFQVDKAVVEQNCLRDAWIESVSVNVIFPDTIELEVTERKIAATVAVPTGSSTVTRVWAISDDGTWLMPIPDRESEAAATVSEQVYIDAESVLQIVDVPYGTVAEIGKPCTDDNVNNALAIVSGMTTELADRVVKVSAVDAASTILTLDNGVEIAFGPAEDIRDKERVCLELLEEYEGTIAYINVRSVTNPTWRSI